MRDQSATLTRAAEFSARVGIDEHRIGQPAQRAAFVQIARQRRQSVVPAAKGPHDSNARGQLGQEARRFIAVQLNAVEADVF